MRLLVTRPAEDAKPLADALKAQGHDVLIQPLLDIRFRTDAPLDLAGAQALLVTSANGLRALVQRPEVTAARALPLLAVGPTSSALAWQAGFRQVHEAGGDVTALARLAEDTCRPDQGVLVHIAGSVVAGDLKGLLEKAGFTVRRAVLYDAAPAAALAGEVKTVLAAGAVDGVLLFSQRTARTFAELVRDADLAGRLSGVTAYCLSLAVADALPDLGFRDVLVAEAPTQQAMLMLTAP